MKKKINKDEFKYYAISNKWEILATFSSINQVEDYIKDHPNVFEIIYRRETSVNGKVHYGPFHVYYSCK